MSEKYEGYWSEEEKLSRHSLEREKIKSKQRQDFYLEREKEKEVMRAKEIERQQFLDNLGKRIEEQKLTYKIKKFFKSIWIY